MPIIPGALPRQVKNVKLPPPPKVPEWKELHQQDIIMRNFDAFVEFHRRRLKGDKKNNIKPDQPETYTGIGALKGYDYKEDPAHPLFHFLGKPDYQPFLDLPSHVLSSMVPTVRLFKYDEDEKTGGKGVTEIKMSDNIKSDAEARGENLKGMLSDRLSRGVGGGIKSVSVDMKGQNMASARKMYEVEIVYYFSSIGDIFKSRTGTKKFKKTKSSKKQQQTEKVVEYSYANLISKIASPNPTTEEEKVNQSSATRIMMEFGYANLSTDSGATKKQLEIVQNSRIVLFLNLYKHKVDFRENGSLIVTANYTGYVEKKMGDIDVFSLLAANNGSTKVKLDEIRELEYEQHKLTKSTAKKGSTSKNKPNNQSKRLKRRIKKNQDKLEKLRTVVYSEVFTELARQGRIYKLSINPSKDMVKAEGYRFKSGGYIKPTAIGSSFDDITERRQRALEQQTNGGGRPEEGWFSRTGDLEVVYLGDIIEIFTKLMKKGKNNDPLDPELRVILGGISVSYPAFSDSETKTHTISLAHFPIAARAWEEWWMQHVLRKGERSKYFLTDFLKDITEGLVANCFELVSGGDADSKRLPTLASATFSTTSFQSPKALAAGVHTSDFLRKSAGITSASSGNEGKRNLNGNANLFVYSQKPAFSRENLGSDKSIYKLKASDTRGVVKRIKFTHSDAKFGAESRMINNGMSSLEASLWGFYNAKVEIYGSTAFYPGAMVRITSAEFDQKQADMIGLGGYYRVLSVNHKIQENIFTTELECQWEAKGS